MTEFMIQIQAITCWALIWAVGGLTVALIRQRDAVEGVATGLFLCVILTPVVMVILLAIGVGIMWAFPL